MLTRRTLLGLTAGALAASGLRRAPATPANEPADSLNALAQAKGMRFGTAVSDGPKGSFNDPDYARLVFADCGLIVPENELKWRAVRPDSHTFDFRHFDHILQTAQSRGLAVRGHNLLWQRPQWMPAWVEHYDFGAQPAREAERLIGEHINTLCNRYAGRLFSYDVVNEAVLPQDGSLAQTALSRAMGGTAELIDAAFNTAHAADPNAQLVYNDYMSWESGNDAHRGGVLKLLEGLRRRKVPVSALGIQSHLKVEPRPQEKSWVKFMDEVTAMDYDVLITELDVNDQSLPADPAQRDSDVAAYAKAYLDLMFDYRRLKDVLVWGLCDSASWLQGFKPLRSDGRSKRPCLYDASYSPKPLRAVLASSLRAAPQR
jgi:endo-1,4-beta-xylanase